MRFPDVSGSDLQRRKRRFPADFSAAYNLVFVPFQQWQQAQVDGWVPLAAELAATRPDFDFFEFPTIQRMNRLAATFINEGMRAGIPNDDTRGRTVTLYIDKKAFQAALDIPGDSEIQVFLVDENGRVLWRESGAYTANKAADLRTFLAP
jgi:hypothetical protein